MKRLIVPVIFSRFEHSPDKGFLAQVDVKSHNFFLSVNGFAVEKRPEGRLALLRPPGWLKDDDMGASRPYRRL